MAIDLGKSLKKFEAKKKTLLMTIGNNGVKMFKGANFEAQGFIDKSVNRWKPKKKKDGRKTLVGKTGTLRNTIFYNSNGRDKLTFGTLASYGQYHNEGQGVPKRQFMGDSAALNKRNSKSIIKAIKKSFV